MSVAVFAVLVALQAPAIPSDGEPVHTPGPAEVDRILADPAYRFCHDPSYRLDQEAHAWCSLIAGTDARCPALRRVCESEPVKKARAAGQTGPASSAGSAGQAGSAEDADEPQMRLSMPVIGLMRVLFIVLIVVFAVAVVAMIVRNLLRDRGADTETQDAPEEPSQVPMVRQSLGVVETDVARLLARARAAASRGDFAGAIRDAYAALLRRLDGDGLIDMHPSRTNGDYVRALRDRPELREPLREVAADVESVQFGSAAPTQDMFARVYERVLPLVGRVTMLIALVGCASAQVGCDRARSRARERDPLGHEAAMALLEAHGRKVERGTRPIKQIRAETTLIVEGSDLDEKQWSELIEWVRDKGGTLVLLGVPEHAAATLGIRAEAPDPSADALVSPTEGTTGAAFLLAIPPGAGLSVNDDRTHWLLERDEEPYGVWRNLGSTQDEKAKFHASVIVLADAQLLTNLSMAVRDNGAYVANLFMQTPKNVLFWDGWAARGAATPLESMHRAHMTPVALQLLALIALFLLFKGVHFGTPREPSRESSRSFSDHVRALGIAYARARASRHAVAMYAAWALDKLREHARIQGRRGLLPLAEAIALRTGRKESEVAKVLIDAHGMREDSGPPSSFRLSQPGSTSRNSASASEHAADLHIMRQLESFLAAFGDARTRAHGEPGTGKR